MRLAYYRAAARWAGVPDLWTEDAAADIALACWQAGDDAPVIVYRKARDAARRYGPRSRRGVSRETVPLSPQERAPDPIGPIVLSMSLIQSWRRLTARQRAALGRRLRGDRMSNLDSAHAIAARRNLRRMLITG